MKTKVPISFEDYSKLCDIAIKKGKSVEDTLMDLLEIASGVEIIKVKIEKSSKSKK